VENLSCTPRALGHVLGERHTRHGIMRASFGLEEWRSLAIGRVGFQQ
jgi:hypothetical protein